MSKQLLIRLVALVAALALIAAACGGDDDDATTATDGGANTEDGGDEEIPTPTPSGEVDNTDLTTKPLVEVPAGDPPTALVVDDIVDGDGVVAGSGDVLIMEYVGVAYSDGLQFDASWDRGQPLTFTLGQGQVIQGWDDGIEGMAVGGRRELVIPPDLAYGEGGSGTGAIGPNETLIFVVDLVGVVPADAAKPAVDVPAEPLAAAGVRPDVEVPAQLGSGELISSDLTVGDGEAAEAGDLVAVRYVGVAASSGDDADSAWGPGIVRTFTLGEPNDLITDGLEQGVEGMAVGGLRQLVVPPELGLSDPEVNPAADDTIVYVVELLGIQDPDLSKPEVTVPATAATELEVTDLVAGTGPIATSGSTLVMQYVGVGQSTDEEFDASWDRGQPFTFTLGQGQVIQGWDDGIEGMAAGGRRELVIPADQAYGDAGSGDSIGPGETLVFVVDLIAVASAPQVEATDLAVGDGPTAERGQTLWVHYVGVSQSTGEQFDASWDRGNDQLFPFVLGVGQVIPGWDQGLVGMQVGGRRQLVIPPELAYGDTGAGGGLIAPGETLVFVVDLVAIG
ncbi:MAG: FKBP-type peptidyl-prolyl cis-trans isomerase [Actinomycetota bacterium]